MGGGHSIYAPIMPAAEGTFPMLSASSLESVLEEGEVVFQFSDHKSPLIN